MRTSKIIRSFILPIVLALSLAACGSGHSSSSPSTFSTPDVATATINVPMTLHTSTGTDPLDAGTRLQPVCVTSYAQGTQDIFSVIVASGALKGTAGTVWVIMPLGAQLNPPWNAAPACP